MSKKPQNVIFLGIDSLRYDRLVAGGYDYDSCPTISFLGKNGIECSKAVTNSGPTQLAFPSIVTSTYPLDYGGYDNGIVSRPNSLPKIFKKANYSTFGFAQDHANTNANGYAEGYDSYESVYDIDTIWKNAVIYTRYYKELLKDGRCSKSEFIELNYIYFSRIIQQTIDYCSAAIEEDSSHINKYKDLYPYDFSVVKNIFELHKISINNNKENFILKHSDAVDINDYFTWIDFIKVYKKYMFSIFFIIKFWPGLKKYFYKFRGKLFKHFATATYMTDRLLMWLNLNKDNNFYAFLFFCDLHENVTSSGLSNTLHRDANKYLRKSNNNEVSYFNKVMPTTTKTGSLLYDASLGYVDSEIKRIIDFLEDNKIINNTLIVIFSDHGTEVGENCSRSLTCSFYDEYVRVPLIFYSQKIIPKSIDNNISLIDLAPTVLDLIGLEIPSSFKGLPVYASSISERQYSMLENAGRGPCDILRKPLNVSFRNNDWKFIYFELSNLENETSFRVELYEIKIDNTEVLDVSNEPKNKSLVDMFIKLAQIRCLEARNIGNNN